MLSFLDVSDFAVLKIKIKRLAQYQVVTNYTWWLFCVHTIFYSKSQCMFCISVCFKLGRIKKYYHVYCMHKQNNDARKKLILLPLIYPKIVAIKMRMLIFNWGGCNLQRNSTDLTSNHFGHCLFTQSLSTLRRRGGNNYFKRKNWHPNSASKSSTNIWGCCRLASTNKFTPFPNWKCVCIIVYHTLWCDLIGERIEMLSFLIGGIYMRKQLVLVSGMIVGWWGWLICIFTT